MNEKYELINGEICALKSLLADTDYLCLKHAEGALTDTEFAAAREQRAAWRAKVNDLEDELNTLTAAEPDTE